MVNWVTEHWLALYGALAGTTALILNFARYRHSIQSDRVQLSLNFEKHPKHDDNLNDLQATDSNKEWERRNLFELYQITVQNIGNVEAHIENVGVITPQKVRKGALRLQTQS